MAEDNGRDIEVEFPHSVADWRDFGERVLRAAYTGALSAMAAIPVADVMGVLDGDKGLNNGLVPTTWEHWLTVIGTGALTAVWTAIKAGIGQGRGSNAADGSLK